MTELINLIFGITVCMIGAAINNFGLVLQKRQVNIKAPPESENKTMTDIKDFLRDPIWILGILMQTFLYLPFLIYSFDLIGITLTQPLSNSGLIFLVLGLILMVNEKLKRLEMFGTFLMVFGAISIALGNVTGQITLDSFIKSINTFWVFFFGIILLSLICLALIKKIKKTRLMFLGFLAGLCYSMVSISMQILTLSLYGIDKPVGLFFLIFGILGAVLGTVFGILTAQEAFKRGQAMNIVPFSQIGMNIIPILAGLLVFGQSILSPVFFWIGTISIIVAASLLARFQ